MNLRMAEAMKQKLERDMKFLNDNEETIENAPIEGKLDYLLRFSNVMNHNIYKIKMALTGLHGFTQEIPDHVLKNKGK